MGSAFAMAHVWKSENIFLFLEGDLSIYPCKWVSGVRLRSPGLCPRHFYPLGHLAGPESFLTPHLWMHVVTRVHSSSPFCCTLRLLFFGRLWFLSVWGWYHGIESKALVSKILSQDKTLEKSEVVHASSPGGRWISVRLRSAWLTQWLGAGKTLRADEMAQ